MCKSERGFSVAELLITTAIVSVMLAGAYQSFLSSSKRLVLQNQIVEMQTDARAAMDFMVRELRLAFDNPTITTKTTANDTITFNPTATLLKHTLLTQRFMSTSKAVPLVAGDRKIVILRGQFCATHSSVAVGLIG